MSRIKTPEIDPTIVYSDSTEIAEIASEFREFMRRMHRDGRTTRTEHREALTILADLETVVDGLTGHAGAILDHRG